MGLQASPCTLHLPCSRSLQSPTIRGAPPQAQHSIRVGGWPLPDGDSTPQDTPSLPWHNSISAQPPHIHLHCLVVLDGVYRTIEGAGIPRRARPHPPTRISWARLLKRVFDIDLEPCPQCGDPLTIIAAIEDPPSSPRSSRIWARPPGHRPEHRRGPSIDSNWPSMRAPVVKPRRQVIFNLLSLFSSACAEKVSAGVIHALSTDEDLLSIVVGGQRVNNSGPSDHR
jgi:hypothetical protein